jgi:two-component system chemotaxis response regulator CheY
VQYWRPSQGGRFFRLTLRRKLPIDACGQERWPKVRALVVDDSSTMRSILRMTLRGAGFEVLEAGNGAEALDRLQKSNQVDIVLVDWNMPEMNGYEFLCAARMNHAYDDTKIVMVTTETEIAQVKAALDHGANEYIMKPFTKDAVIEKLQLMGMLPQGV